MTHDDRSLERAARSWLEEGPTRAPDRPVEGALARIQTTRQERDLVPWRMPRMSATARLAAALVAVAIVAVLGAVAVRLPTGPGGQPTSSPTAAPDVTPAGVVAACTLMTGAEADRFSGLGVTPTGIGTGPETTCMYTTEGGTVARLTLTRPGGKAAFEAAKTLATMAAASAGGSLQVVAQIAADNFFDPATMTLFVFKGDSLVEIYAGPPGGSAQARLGAETAVAGIVLPRL